MKKHNKIFLGMALAAALLPLAACTDDVQQTVRLNIATEGSNGKFYISNRNTYFEMNDRIAINDQPYRLVNDGNGGKHWADVPLPSNGNSFVAFYPRSFQNQVIGTTPEGYTASTTGDGHISKTVQVKFPRKDTCFVFSYDGSEMGVDIPMVALAKTTDNSLYFRHAGAVIALTIINNLSGTRYESLNVDSISVYGIGGAKLSGVRDVTITDGTSGTISVADPVNQPLGSHYVSCHIGNNGAPWIYPLGNTDGRRSSYILPISVAPCNSSTILKFTVHGKWRYWNGSQYVEESFVKYFSSYVSSLARNKYYSRNITITFEGNTDPDPAPDNPIPGLEGNLPIESHTPWGNLW